MIDSDAEIREEERLSALYSYHILDSLTEKEFDNLTQLASEIADMPIAMINLIDANRQWTKSAVGVDTGKKEIPREKSVCQYTIRQRDTMEVQDMAADPRFCDFDYVKNENGLRYYFGVPLLTSEGYAIGSLCVLDYAPRSLDNKTIRQLRIIASEVMTHLEFHKQNIELQQLNEYKVRLMKMLSHDMRSPLNGIIGLSSMLKEQMMEEAPEHVELLNVIEQSSTQLNQMIDEVMNYSIMESGGIQLKMEDVKLQELVDDIAMLYRPASRIKNIDLEFYTENLDEPVELDPDKFEQIFGNILSNAIKYTRSGGWVRVSLIRKLKKGQELVELVVSDSGVGMSEFEQEELLDSDTYVPRSKGTSGEKSTGIGFSIVKHIVSLFSGEIDIESHPGEGSTFRVTIPV